MRTGDNKEFLRKYGKIIKQLFHDENPPPCPINGGECFYINPPHPMPCSICLEHLAKVKEREEVQNEEVLLMRAKR